MAQVKERAGGGEEWKELLADKPLLWLPQTFLARFPLHARKTSGTQGNKPRDFETTHLAQATSALGLSCLSSRTDINFDAVISCHN